MGRGLQNHEKCREGRVGLGGSPLLPEQTRQGETRTKEEEPNLKTDVSHHKSVSSELPKDA